MEKFCQKEETFGGPEIVLAFTTIVEPSLTFGLGHLRSGLEVPFG